MKLLRMLVHGLASLKLTVALFAAAMLLIFAGTLAQVNQGIWQTIDGYFRSPVAWIKLQLFFPEQLARVPGSLPFPGGFLLAGLLMLNLVAAHAVRFRLSRKRIGIIVLHAGLIVLLAGEFATGLLADEGMMTIDEGSSSSFIEDVREVELAIVDRAAADADRVVAVPQSRLERAARSGERINHAELPFGISVNRWMANSRLLRVTDPSAQNPATDGTGLEARPDPLPRAAGVDAGAVDAPSAYVTLLDDDGFELGTWLVSLNLDAPQEVMVDGRRFEIGLRFKRTYKPYTLHLIDFRHDKFVGTETPRNFSSHLRLVDPPRGTDREVDIYMNHPLRYAGETFYQSAYKEGDTGTILQVVRNPGWIMPYVACALVSFGMILHFATRLGGFLRRNAR